jgi:UDP-N-acetylglucosamine--N-acetylmuramyl-(pentapeptide) pyrophosphoryl-undecaprenol N-acetylglucosamine transferase
MSVARPVKTVLFAGGGTGGHLFPGIALAEEFQRQEDAINIVFAGTRRGLEARVIPELGYTLVFLEVHGLVGVKGIKRVKSLANLPKAVIQALILLVRYRPTLVVGLGGYASAPVLMAAMVAGLPWVLQEQNAYPGLVNRTLSPFAGAVFTAFDKARESLKNRKVYNFGNPLRSHLQEDAVPEVMSGTPDSEEIADATFNILIVGGSQGARVLNRLLPEVIAGLTTEYPKLKVVHQAGKADLETVSKAYMAADCDAEVTAFIDDIGSYYRAADLVVCRAGALTLAELAELGKASILVPFPFAAHDHQVFNARAFAEKGAALIELESELSAAGLSDAIAGLIQHPETLARMGRMALEMARPQAREQIVKQCLKLIQEH